MITPDQQLDRRTFERVRGLIYQRAGIALGDSKQAMVQGRLAKRLRALRLESLPSYLDQLDGNPNSDEWQHFTNALTTNLTSFFREAHHFDHLATVLRQARGQDLFRIWCSASSTGEEPWSIAMVVDEVGAHGPRRVEIIASDIDTQVLQTAAQGIYPIERIEDLAKARRQRFFLKGQGPNAGRCRIRPELLKKVQFQQVNLLAPKWPVRAPLDVVFCRNVMIYFDKAAQRELVRRFAALLSPGGHLYVGHSESQFQSEDLFAMVGRTTYRRLSP